MDIYFNFLNLTTKNEKVNVITWLYDMKQKNESDHQLYHACKLIVVGKYLESRFFPLHAVLPNT